MQVSALPQLPDEQIDGTELVPAVKGGATYRASVAGLGVAAAVRAENAADAAGVLEHPNLFTLPQLLFADLADWTASVPLAVEMRGGRRCLKVTNGAATIVFPASDFAETGEISASLWVEELQNATSLSRLRVNQLDAQGASLGNSIVSFGSVDFAAATVFSLSGIALDPACASVQFVIQTAGSGGGGTAWVRNLLVAQGDNSQFRLPDFAASFDDRASANAILDIDDLTIEPSANLAASENLIDGKYVSSTGGIVTAAGWKTFRVPVTPGETYSFGNFAIDTAGYSAFYDAQGEATGDMVAFNGSFTTGNLPKSYVAPAGAAWLYVTVARPTNAAEDWALAIINQGANLIAYVSPVGVVKQIGSYRVAGDVDTSGFAQTGQDAAFGNLSAASITTGALVANLPSGAARPAEVDVNEAWIDTSAGGTDGVIKVRLS